MISREPSATLIIRVARYVKQNPGCKSTDTYRGVVGDTTRIAKALRELCEAGIVNRTEGTMPIRHYLAEEIPEQLPQRLRSVAICLESA